jgi:hypothetical protein
MDQCKWIKKNGEQCKNKAVSEAEYCWLHSLQLSNAATPVAHRTTQTSDVKQEVTEQEKTARPRIPDWAFLGIVLGAVYAFLASFLENAFSLLISISESWAARVLPVYFLATLIIVIWAIRVVSKGSAKQSDAHNT